MPPGLFTVAASFTADPLGDLLSFWLAELELGLRPVIAPYDQVIQQLLDPRGLFGQEPGGVNAVLVRPDDWLRRAPEAGVAAARGQVEAGVDALARALAVAAARDAAPMLCALCPCSPATVARVGGGAFHDALEARLAAATGHLDVRLLRWAEQQELYPVGDPHDPHGDALAHIPYTGRYFAALAALLTRRAYGLLHPPRKVLAVDCDGTLWGEVAGEVGASGVEVGPAHRALQGVLKAQKDRGLLLAVVSKNEREDALAVFRSRAEMPLGCEDFVALRTDWRPKSEGLRALADELRLGLDGFAFLDDSPLERAEVAARCPEVLVLEPPDDPSLVADYLRHVWALDRARVTDEDRHRSARYREDVARARLQSDVPTLADFLAGLGLEVTFRVPDGGDLARVAQLTERTNQFNTTTIRRSEGEVAALLRARGVEVRVVAARDRFGDYGSVGVMVARARDAALVVEALLLSCRALGRGVESRMLRELGSVARARGLARVDVRFAPTARNRPARDFLDAVGASFRGDTPEGEVYRIPAEVAAGVPLVPVAPARSGAAPFVKTAGPPASSAKILRIARELRDVDAILAAVAASRARAPSAPRNPREPTPIEAALCALWSDVLGVAPVGVDQDFLALGGDSVAAAQVVSRLHRAFGVHLSLGDFFEARTVEALALAVAASLAERPAALDLP